MEPLYYVNKIVEVLQKLKKSVVSKGGTTEAALQKLDRLKTKKILMESIKDAYAKAKLLGKAK